MSNDLLLRRRMLMQAGGSPTPPTPIPYQQVEYLESNGSQAIDTGVYLDGDSKLIVEYQGFTNKYFCVGARKNFMSQAFLYCNGGASGSNYNQYFINYNGSYATPACPNDENWHTLEMTNVVKVDGNGIATFTAGTFTTYHTCRLFAYWGYGIQSYTYGYMRIKSAKIYDGNDNLLLDAIAVRDGTTGEMYDQVSQSLLTRVGTFIIGPDIN